MSKTTRSRGESKTRWIAMVSSTTPRLGPRWPLLRLQVSTSTSRISLPSWSSWASERPRRSRGDVIDSRMPIAAECTWLEVEDRDGGLVEAADLTRHRLTMSRYSAESRNSGTAVVADVVRSSSRAAAGLDEDDLPALADHDVGVGQVGPGDADLGGVEGAVGLVEDLQLPPQRAARPAARRTPVSSSSSR